MKTKLLIFICVTIFCTASNIAMAQTYANGDHAIQSPNMQTALQTTSNIPVGSDVVAPMASTTYDQTSGSAPFSNRRNAGDNPFGDGGLPSNPKEPGVPMGEIPWALLLILAAGYAVFRTHRINQLD
jgi:hypothetical protein